MALNLGHALRDAVDGPSLDELVGEDPADVDLPALSARIRRRRRGRAATRSAVGVVAAGAIALVGVNGGLDRRGVETPSGPLAGSGSVAAPPLAPLSSAQLPAVQAQLCGRDVLGMPTVGSARLVQTNVATTVHQTDLGTLAGRTLTAAVVAAGDSGAAGSGQIVLTTGDTIVAVGAPQPYPGDSLIEFQPSGQTMAVSPVAVGLTPCPSPSGTPAGVPAGTYQVQYLVEDARGGTGRSGAGPWSVTLLDTPPSWPHIAEGFPSAEVPVIGGASMASRLCPATSAGWSVQVVAAGDDALTRAADALRAAGAEVGTPDAPVNGCDTAAGSSDTEPAPPQATLDALQATLTAQRATLATTQAQHLQADMDALAAQQALNLAVGSGADATTVENARLQLLQRQAALTSLDASVQAAQEAIASQEALIAQAQAAAAAQQGTASRYRATVVSNGNGSYTALGPTQFTAVTASWTVRVEESTEAGETVLTYSVLPR